MVVLRRCGPCSPYEVVEHNERRMLLVNTITKVDMFVSRAPLVNHRPFSFWTVLHPLSIVNHYKGEIQAIEAVIGFSVISRVEL